MAYSLESWSYNEVLSAAKMNRQVRDNLAALWVGAAAGDMDYYASATAKQRVAIGALGSLWIVLPTGLPGWGGLATCALENSSTQSISSGAWATLELNTVVSDGYSIKNGSSPNYTIALPSTMKGIWIVSLSASLAANATGWVGLTIVSGATTIAAGGIDAHLSSGTHDIPPVVGLARNVSGMSLIPKIFQNSGGALNASLAKFSAIYILPEA